MRTLLLSNVVFTGSVTNRDAKDKLQVDLTLIFLSVSYCGRLFFLFNGRLLSDNKRLAV